KLGLRLPLHLYVDTGMSRGGLNAAQFQRVVEQQGDYPHTAIVGVYTHFATADSDPAFADEQLERFERLVIEAGDALPRNVILHAANTAATLRDTRFHLDMVRPGLGLCGYGAEMLAPGLVIGDCPQLEPVARWMSRVIHVQRYPRRTPVGYDSTFKLQRASVLGLVPVGYADGYPVALSGKAQVRVSLPDSHANPQPARVLGKVNMDQMVVDLTDLVSEEDELSHFMHTEVEIYSDDPTAPNALPSLAGIAKSNVYELLCRLSPSVPKRYAYR
ncbi:MAG: alanine racemase, partial [Rhodospirillales bacterium]|nr:alanine racemase [Rhodospirillales bacterium]